MSIRQFATSLVTWLFAFLLCMTVATLGIVLVLSNPGKVKKAFDQSGLYQTLVSGILQQSQQQTPSLNDPVDTIPLSRPEVQAAIQASFPPNLLQQQSETVIDATYVWLQGKSALPDFKINLTGAKASFALAMGNYVQKRLSALPACSIATAPDSFDAFNSDCLPSGLDVNGEVQKVELEVAGSIDFLPTTTLTANSFLGSNGKPLFTQLQELPGYYRTAVTLPYIFAGLALVAAAWVYNKMSKHTAGNVKPALITALVVGVFAFIVFFSIFKLFLKS